MSDEYERQSITWSAVGLPEPIVVGEGQEVAVTFDPGVLPPTVVGVTLYDAASGHVAAALERDESGELVRVDPSRAVVGAVISPDGGRWVHLDEPETHESPAQPSEDD